MKRAIVIYLEDKRNLMIQFGCLYTSYKYVKSLLNNYQITDNQIDLVVFGSTKALNKIPNDLIKIEHNAVSYNSEWKDYHYINSIECLISADFLDDYNYILRTDVDTFITPSFNNYYPNLYSAGKGGYVNDQITKDNLKRISDHLGLRYRDINNIGSTNYGDAKLIREVCKLAYSTTKYILNNEFNGGEGKWPSWFNGVSLLYGTEIAINHLVKDISIDGEKLDYGSTNEENITDHPHIHCWHTDNMFSKFAFELGKYDNLSMDNLNLNKVKNYCLYMALKSKKEMPQLYLQTQLSLDTRHTRYKYLRHGLWGLDECKDIRELMYDNYNNLYEISYNTPLSEDQKQFIKNNL